MAHYFFNSFKNILKHKLFFSFMFLILASFTSTAQSASNDSSVVNTSEVASEKVSSNKMDFAIWFMGTNHTPNSLIVPESKNAKRILMSSGVVPNRLLIESFLKKAVSFETSLS